MQSVNHRKLLWTFEEGGGAAPVRGPGVGRKGGRVGERERLREENLHQLPAGAVRLRVANISKKEGERDEKGEGE